jgi:heme exporter protein B
MSLWKQAWFIARTDLRVEGRSGEILWIVLPYGALALFLIPIAAALPLRTLSDIGIGMYWVVVLLFGMFVTLRQSSQSSPQERDLMRLTLSDPAALFLGKSVASAALLGVFQLVMGPIAVAFFNPLLPSQWWLLVPVSALLAVAMAMTGTLVGFLVAGIRSSTALAPLLAAGLAFPSLVGASIATMNLADGRSIVTPIALLLLVVAVTSAIGIASSTLLEDQ